MKKSLLFLAAAAAVSMSAYAQDLTEGTELYFRNVKTGMWLNCGYSWGTKGVLKDQARAFEVFDEDYGSYKLKTSLGEIKHDGSEIYLDGGAGVSPQWFIDKNANGYYTIDDGGWYLCPEEKDGEPVFLTYGDGVDEGLFEGETWESTQGALHSYNFIPVTGKTAYSTDDMAIMWEIFTRDELIKLLEENANVENPMDATFLIKAHMLDRNDTENATAWTYKQGDATAEIVFPDFGWGFHFDGYAEWAIAGTYAWLINDKIAETNDEDEVIKEAPEATTDVVSQEVFDAPVGTYEVAYRVVNQPNTSLTLKFNDTEAEVTDGSDNNLWYSETTGLLNNRKNIKKATFTVGEDGKLSISMTKDAQKDQQNRFSFKSFIIKYLGDDNEEGGVKAVASENIDANAPAEYFNMQGIRVAEPTTGLYIVKQGNTVSKQLIRK